MITNDMIQRFYEKAAAQGTDVMRWSDFFDVIQEAKNTETPAPTAQPVRFQDLPVFADDAAAAAGGLTGGELYRTSTGAVLQKLNET